jgi:hypothetical protein
VEEASFVAWLIASSGLCFPYLSTPVTGKLLNTQLVCFVKSDDNDIGRVDRDRLFLVIGLTGLGTFDVKATFF